MYLINRSKYAYMAAWEKRQHTFRFTKSLIEKILFFPPTRCGIQCIIWFCCFFPAFDTTLYNLHGLEAAAVMHGLMQPGCVRCGEGATSFATRTFTLHAFDSGIWHSTVRSEKYKMLISLYIELCCCNRSFSEADTGKGRLSRRKEGINQNKL